MFYTFHIVLGYLFNVIKRDCCSGGSIGPFVIKMQRPVQSKRLTAIYSKSSTICVEDRATGIDEFQVGKLKEQRFILPQLYTNIRIFDIDKCEY